MLYVLPLNTLCRYRLMSVDVVCQVWSPQRRSQPSLFFTLIPHQMVSLARAAPVNTLHLKVLCVSVCVCVRVRASALASVCHVLFIYCRIRFKPLNLTVCFNL